MKKLFIAFVLSSALVSCKKETSTPNTSGNNNTDTTKASNQTIGKPGPNITDIEGNSYKTIYIGTQQWMAENLKVSRYNDGTIIPNVTYYLQWSNLKTGAWVFYNNDTTNNAIYGKLYNWYALNPTTNGYKYLCPTGWHVPTDLEWKVLTDYLGGESVAGGKMKEVGTTSWNGFNKDATNTSLFSALPGGINVGYGDFVNVGTQANWWSSSEFNSSNAWRCTLYSNDSEVFRNTEEKRAGLSVRCLKD